VPFLKVRRQSLLGWLDQLRALEPDPVLFAFLLRSDVLLDGGYSRCDFCSAEWVQRMSRSGWLGMS
jgi:hypothetical protein